MCVGGGLEASSNEPVAKLLQQRLRATDFSNLSAEEGLKCLFRLLCPANEGKAEQQAVLPQLVKSGTRLECAIVDNAQRRMIRKFVHETLPNEVKT